MIFPTSDETAEVVQRGKESVHLPVALVSAKGSAIPSCFFSSAILVQRDNLDAFYLGFFIRNGRIVSGVANASKAALA
jgi:hypothetical protein